MTTTTTPIPVRDPVVGADGQLQLRDMLASSATCSATDPGPDPTYDPDPIPDFDFGDDEPEGESHVDVSSLLRCGDDGPLAENLWGLAVLRQPGALAGKSDLLTLASFESLLVSIDRAQLGLMHLASNGRRSVPPQMLDRKGWLDRSRLRRAYAQGDTLYLRQAQRFSEPLRQCCHALQLDLFEHGVRLERPVDAHVFATPSGSQGFPVHRDEHANFVLQLEGTKQWTVFELDDAINRRAVGGVSGAELAGAKAWSFQLEAGDVLYMPAWWPHEAHTEGSSSLHVTLRAFPRNTRGLE